MFNFDNSYERLPGAFFRKVNPTPVAQPSFFITNPTLAEELGLNPDEIFSEEGLDVLSGNKMPKEASSIAMAYMGHQFGYPAILGDGRAILIGEQITPEGERRDIQLKGAGRTDFSRGGDGRASLGPIIREYIMSEAMHVLGVPTTRALAVVKTGQPVYRSSEEEGAILTRVASSHLRVGTFEWIANMEGGDVEALLDYAIHRHDPDLADSPDKAYDFLCRVAERQGRLIAQWMSLGFVHGVMNTDNMTISGETIDYGPCAFLDVFDPKTVFSSIDHFGRYRFENQGQIGIFNLNKLGDALLNLLDEDPTAAEEKKAKALQHYGRSFEKMYFQKMGEKLGFKEISKEDEPMIREFLNILYDDKLDYTESFLRITYGDKKEEWSPAFREFYEKLVEKTGKEGESLRLKTNPAIIPKNYLVERAIQEAEAGDSSFLFHFLDLLKDPFSHSEEQKALRTAPGIPHYKTFCGT
ncbi:Protein adenylyltransferase SelO [Aedoeadaptatus nemausensis]|uniref:Protein nucleotidyltransferase YdiU n=1 Tax=Aedoeadaptatus nemausensis TaxID=2582829 RepID=A0A6V6Y1A6_9FIRM|nr:YdiU family protein [Peptoniphilus nemausensis]CAC9928616.1 Protein adenylyltransferase SelO [Peptoniphilus nemausensis]